MKADNCPNIPYETNDNKTIGRNERNSSNSNKNGGGSGDIVTPERRYNRSASFNKERIIKYHILLTLLVIFLLLLAFLFKSIVQWHKRAFP
ncbi:unnamed protein product [Hymenolepis diminuta]|uniref:Uncharacterized protein n=1 Tax=Hymenolepis diminuta TaxID=6216 RepID=A0A564XYW5_HYMDI|nr:unnamed protein product [Hymenolepis diminuta]